MKHFPLLVVLLLATLAGCGGIFPEPPKRTLYRVHPTVSLAAALPQLRSQLIIATPAAPAALDTARIALSRAPETLDYFADAEWDDRVPFLIQTAVIDGFQKSAALPRVGAPGLGLLADLELATTIGDFTAVYDSPNGPPQVVVRLEAKLLRLPERRIVDQISVSREAPTTANSLPEIVRGFDAALGAAIQEIITWTVHNPALSGRRR